jgi:hypothetical protein
MPDEDGRAERRLSDGPRGSAKAMVEEAAAPVRADDDCACLAFLA